MLNLLFVANSRGFVSLGMGKHLTLSPPRSRVVEMIGASGNGSSIPSDGSVWPTAIYWCYVSVGTPPVQFPVAIDSGSGDLDISGKGCEGCPTTPPNKAYDHTASSSSKSAFPYKFSNSYQTCDLQDPTAVCTISGALYSDDVTLAGLGPVTVNLGSITSQTSNFDQFKQIGGVMGFTMGLKENVFAELVAQGKADNVWAICMNDGPISNGTITIGGVDERFVASGSKVEYVPDSGRGFHSVTVASITLGGQRAGGHKERSTTAATTIPVNEIGILDTGTNVLLLPRKLMNSLEASMCVGSIAGACKQLWGRTAPANCASLSPSEVAQFPPMTLNLENGVHLVMTARDYILQGSPTCPAGLYALGIRDGGTAGGSGFIIGDTTMRNYYLVFNLEEKKIGWGPVNRATCGGVEK